MEFLPVFKSHVFILVRSVMKQSLNESSGVRPQSWDSVLRLMRFSRGLHALHHNRGDDLWASGVRERHFITVCHGAAPVPHLILALPDYS